MIDEVLVFLKNYLNAYLNSRAGITSGVSAEDKVVFIDGDKMDPIHFKLGAVTALLVNVEEERVLRPAEPYTANLSSRKVKVQPEIRMNLYVLFVARFKEYKEGLRYLSMIIQYFQNRRVLEHQNAPELSDRIDRLVIELKTLPLAQQNELWNALRTAYHPSVLYKVNMAVFRDEDAMEMPEISETRMSLTE